MTGYDVFYSVCAVLVSLVGALCGGQAGSGFTSFLLYLTLFFVPGAFLLRWPRRFAEREERKRLLSLPRKKIQGQIRWWAFTDAGKTETVAVPSGYSVSTRGDFFSHYQYERSCVHNGCRITIMDPQTADMTEIRTPKKQYDAMGGGLLRLKKDIEKMGFPPMSYFGRTVCISYVTDEDGTNYFVGMEPPA